MEPEENPRDSGSTEISCGTREKAIFLDCEIRDVTSTWEAGFAKTVTQDAILEKRNGIRDKDDGSSRCGIVVKKERDGGIRTARSLLSFQTLIELS